MGIDHRPGFLAFAGWLLVVAAILGLLWALYLFVTDTASSGIQALWAAFALGVSGKLLQAMADIVGELRGIRIALERRTAAVPRAPQGDGGAPEHSKP